MTLSSKDEKFWCFLRCINSLMMGYPSTEQLSTLQFVQILDILKVVMKQKDINYLMLTGSTPVDVRQSLVDQFTNDDNMELPVFLLSTKAGGMGINLTASSVVIL